MPLNKGYVQTIQHWVCQQQFGENQNMYDIWLEHQEQNFISKFCLTLSGREKENKFWFGCTVSTTVRKM